jgi:hypothetical protein
MKKSISIIVLSLLPCCPALAQGVDFSRYVAKVTIMQKYDMALLMPPPILNDEATLPGFPSRLWQKGVGGEIHFACIIDEQGKISRYEIKKCTNDAFGKSFARAIKTWTYQRLDDSFYKEVGSSEKKAIKGSDKIIYPLNINGVIKFGIHDE